MWGQRLVEFIEKIVKGQRDMLKVCLIRVWGHHWNFYVGRSVEGVKAVRNGSDGKPSSQNRPTLHSEKIADLNVVSEY